MIDDDRVTAKDADIIPRLSSADDAKQRICMKPNDENVVKTYEKPQAKKLGLIRDLTKDTVSVQDVDGNKVRITF